MTFVFSQYMLIFLASVFKNGVSILVMRYSSVLLYLADNTLSADKLIVRGSVKTGSTDMPFVPLNLIALLELQ